MLSDTNRPTETDTAATHPHAGRTIAVLTCAAFVVILNETVMTIALPRLMNDFSISASTAQWVTTAYLLTMAVVIPVTGYLIGRFPLPRLYAAAMLLFAAGTLCAALAPTFPSLVLARVVQATGAAIMMPLLFTTVLNLVPHGRRGRIMGMTSIVISVAPAIGPTMSGMVLEHLSWRFVFWCVLPVAVLFLVLGRVWIRDVDSATAPRVDVVSVILSASSFSGLIFALTLFGSEGSAEPVVAAWIPALVGSFCLVLFTWRQLYLRDGALLDLRVFGHAPFSLAATLVFTAFVAMFGSLILLPFYLQQVLEISTLHTGLLLLPGGVTLGLLAPIVGRLCDKYGPTPLVLPGAVLASIGTWSMRSFDEHTNVAIVVGVHMLFFSGISCMFTPLLTSTLGSLPRHLYSHGSAIISTLQQVAGATGTALFITVMGQGAARAEANGLSPVDAATSGIHEALTWGGIISIATILLALFVRRQAPGADERPSGEDDRRSI